MYIRSRAETRVAAAQRSNRGTKLYTEVHVQWRPRVVVMHWCCTSRGRAYVYNVMTALRAPHTVRYRDSVVGIGSFRYRFCSKK